MARDGVVIVKRAKRGGDHAHHGGAWKVAYADFVTGMRHSFSCSGRSTRPRPNSSAASPIFRDRSSWTRRRKDCASRLWIRTCGPCSPSARRNRYPYTKKLLGTIAKYIDRLPDRISSSRHTAGRATEAGAPSSRELSAARATPTCAIITGAGLDPDRIYEVAGKAGSEPLLPEHPAASANRRLTIVVLREAPPVPPDPKP